LGLRGSVLSTLSKPRALANC